jgi:hypothetical protein
MRIILRILLILCLAHSAESEAQIDVISNENPSPVAKPPVKSGVRRIKKNSVPQKAYELAAELRYYRYSEPGVVEHKGPMAGIFGEWLWQSGLGKGRLQGAFHYGVLDYSGGLCDLSGNCTPYEAKTTDFIFRTSTRFDVQLGSNFLIFGGLGYRFLLDKGQGVGFYQRLGQWAYVPVGVRLQSGSQKGDFFTELELDWIGYGIFKSSLSEVSQSLPDVVHNQTGYGYMLLAGMNIGEDMRLAAVYEHWNLNESERVQQGDRFFVEPKNESTSYGLRLGWTF